MTFDMDSGVRPVLSGGLPDPNQLVWTNVEGNSEPFPFVGVGAVQPRL